MRYVGIACICLWASVLLAGCSGGGSPGTTDERIRLDTRLDQSLEVVVDRPPLVGALGTTVPGAPVAASATIRASRDLVEVNAPPGTTVHILTGDKTTTFSSTITKTLRVLVAQIPWYMYLVAAISAVGGCAAWYFLGRWVFAALGIGLGAAILGGYVLVQIYPWVFLLLGVGVVLIFLWLFYAYYCADQAKALQDAAIEKFKSAWSALKAVVPAIQKQPSIVQDSIKADVAANASSAGQADAVKDVITDVKRDL